MATVKELKDRVARLRSELRQAERELLAAQVALQDFQVGDVVEARKRYDGEWREAVVRLVKPFDYGDPGAYYHVSFRKKDGEFGKPVVWVRDRLRALPSGDTEQGEP